MLSMRFTQFRDMKKYSMQTLIKTGGLSILISDKIEFKKNYYKR